MFNAVIIIDNLPSEEDPELLTEHGLSVYFEVNGEKWLCDVGNSSKYEFNATRLYIDLSKVKGLVLSHGHKDHCGGLKSFVENNADIPVYAASNINDYKYFSTRHGGVKDISLDSSLLIDNEKFMPVYESTRINSYMSLCYTEKCKYKVPVANKFLFKGKECGTGLVHDDFSHEIAIAVEMEKGLVIISSCSHNGMLNIIDSCCEFTGCNNVIAFIGGLHLVEGPYETEKDLEEMASQIKRHHSDMHIYTGHCSGKSRVDFLSGLLPGQVHSFHTGMTFSL